MLITRRMVFSSTLMLGALMVFASLIIYLHHRPLPAEVQSLTSAQFTAGTIDRKVRLPHDWVAQALPLKTGSYQLDFFLPSLPAEGWGVYLPALDLNAVVFLNGRRIGDGGRLAPPMARNHNRPLLFALPTDLLRPGDNRITIEIHSELRGRGLLGPVHLGAMTALAPHYRARYTLKITAMRIVTVATLAISALMLLMWWLRREEPMYLWFAVTAGFWLIYILNYHVIDIPLPTLAWVALVRFAALGWFVLSIVFFINRFLGLKQPRYEKALAVIYTALPLFMLTLEPAQMLAFGLRVYTPLVWLLGLDPAIKMTRAVWGRRDQEIIWLTFSGLAILSLGVHDILMNLGLIGREHGYFIPYAPPLTVIVFAVMLVRRFVNTLRASERLNRELERRVEQKVEEVRSAYDKLTAVEREQALNRERERIMRDMHDGVGGHLVSTLYMLQRGHTAPDEVREALQVALADLRLMIDSMDSAAEDLSAVLANLRSRLEPQLEKAGIRSRWQLGDLPSLADFGPEAALQIMRIVQEAITNIIKHAQASEMALSSAVAGGAVEITIRDNGVGLDAAATGPGHRGLTNMRQRAGRIGAILEVETAAPGTRVRLRWIPPPGDRV